MTIDERIDKLTEQQEKTQVMLAEIVVTLGRLERIALSHEVRLDSVEETLLRLEGRKPKIQ